MADIRTVSIKIYFVDTEKVSISVFKGRNPAILKKREADLPSIHLTLFMVLKLSLAFVLYKLQGTDFPRDFHNPSKYFCFLISNYEKNGFLHYDANLVK